jgi:predicted PurR-regulated permease PerM
MWLVNGLLYLDWQIFTWHINVGTAVEAAIDWVLDGLNTVITFVGQLAAWWEEFRQEVIDFFTEIPKWLNELWQYFLNFADTFAGWISDWWDGIFETVKDWVLTVVDKLKEIVTDIGDTLERWVTTVENFFTQVLPELAHKLDVLDMIKSFFEPWRDLLNFLSEVAADIGEFFSDPLAWVYNKLDDFFERFW